MDKTNDFAVQSDVNAMVTCIKAVIRACESNQIACWLNYGALLGMVRDGQLLPWNNDAELCCWFREGISVDFIKVVDHLNSLGYCSFYYSAIGALTVRADGVNVNVNCIWRDERRALRPHETAAEPNYSTPLARAFYWAALLLSTGPVRSNWSNIRSLTKKGAAKLFCVSFIRLLPPSVRKRLFLLCVKSASLFGGKFQKTIVPAQFYDEMQRIDFYGLLVNVPSNAPELLAFIYGEDWQVPKANWSFYSEANVSTSQITYDPEPWDYESAEFL